MSNMFFCVCFCTGFFCHTLHARARECCCTWWCITCRWWLFGTDIVKVVVMTDQQWVLIGAELSEVLHFFRRKICNGSIKWSSSSMLTQGKSLDKDVLIWFWAFGTCYSRSFIQSACTLKSLVERANLELWSRATRHEQEPPSWSCKFMCGCGVSQFT